MYKPGTSASDLPLTRQPQQTLPKSLVSLFSKNPSLLEQTQAPLWSDVTTAHSPDRTEVNQVFMYFCFLFSWTFLNPNTGGEVWKFLFFPMSQTHNTGEKEESHLLAQTFPSTGEPGTCFWSCRCCDRPKEPEAHPIPLPCRGDSETWEAARLER